MQKQILITMSVDQFKKIVEETIELKIGSIIEKNNFEKLLTTEEVTQRLGVTRVTLYAWRKKGLIKSYKIENRVFFKWSEILNHLKEGE